MYRIELSRRAERDLERLPTQAQKRLAEAIDSLAEEPRPSGVRKLTSEEELYRVRVGDYRIVYAIRDEILLVLIVRAGNRRDIYRSLG